MKRLLEGSEKGWQMWLLLRSRQLAFALGMVIFLIVLLLFGGEG